MGLPLRYNYRNLFRRKLRTGLTVLGIALVIATAVIMLAYARGLLWSLRNNGDPDNIMVLSRRASDVAFSSMKKGEFEVLGALVLDDVVWHTPEADLLALDDLLMGSLPVDLVAPYVNHTFIIRIEGVEGGRYGDRKLGMVKGVDPARAFEISTQLELREGRLLTDDDQRVALVGALTWARLGVEKEDLGLGAVLQFNGASWPIVGIFDTNGTGADGEIWVPIDELMTTLDRTSYTHAMVRVDGEESRERVLQLVNRSDQTELRALGEVEYYNGYAESFETFALIGGIMALIIAACGLMIGMNTMYTAISGRVREIGMLRVLGFSRRSILFSFLLESLFIALVGGLFGCVLGSTINGMPMKITMGAFVLRVDPLVLGIGMSLAVLIGLVGAYIPARRALRMAKVEAMRYA